MKFYLMKFTVIDADEFTYMGQPIANGDHEKVVNQGEIIGLDSDGIVVKMLKRFAGFGTVSSIQLYPACITCKVTGKVRGKQIDIGKYEYVTCPVCKGSKITTTLAVASRSL